MRSPQPMLALATTATPAGPRAATYEVAAPMRAAAGRVAVQARTMRPARFQWTEVDLRAAPAPKMAPVQTWVVDRGMPRCVEVRMTAALVVSAVNPWGVWMLLMRLPNVRMMRQPPT